MSDAPLTFDKDVDGYLLCLAQSERNPDMQGYAVRLSTFVVNVCIAILITWSEEEVRSSVSLVLLQIATILLCTAVAMIRRDLSVSDAHFALTLTVSPLALYFVYSLFRFIRKRPNHLYARLGTSKIIVAILTGILVIWWIVFDLLIYFSDIFKTDDSVFIPFLPIFWIIYFLRHLKDIRAEYKRHMEKPRDTWKTFSWVQRSYLVVKLFIIAQWDVIALSHRWLFFLLIFIFYVSWGSSLLLWAIDTNEWYHDVVAANYEPYANVPYQPSPDFDPLGYGQLLAIAVAIEPLWAVVRLSFLRRREITRWILQFPKSLWNGIIFILTGKRNPWKIIQEKRFSNEPDYRNLFHPDVLEFGEIPISSRRTPRMYGESWGSEDLGKAQGTFPGLGSPKLEYYDPYLEVAQTLPYNREKEIETVPLHRPDGAGRQRH
ncbi:hypothetical protein Moror_11835 [Moniliophthora roreri MCA 2997]|uniref:Uncharacterized protein n=1 Tax=Moniliophthora roreri (strain MCA 2997) TaxID=1381753 RepID=V2X037_MONRO|nr:hypothetical protein Moror_11835 [Moniliophthora roreri MCA 2997]